MFYDEIQTSADYIRNKLTAVPTVGIVLGSGLGEIVDAIQDKVTISYKEIPYFLQSTVAGHAGNLVAGRIGNVQVIAMQGRVHYYRNPLHGRHNRDHRRFPSSIIAIRTSSRVSAPTWSPVPIISRFDPLKARVICCTSRMASSGVPRIRVSTVCTLPLNVTRS